MLTLFVSDISHHIIMKYCIILLDENSTEYFNLPGGTHNHAGISRSAATRLPLRDSRWYNLYNFYLHLHFKKMMTCQLSAKSHKLNGFCILSQLSLNGKSVLLLYLLYILQVITIFFPFCRPCMYSHAMGLCVDMYICTPSHSCIL